MPVGDQGAQGNRYVLVPRTAIFARRGESYLLIHGALTKRLWPGLYNAIGGHIERGESPHGAARREFFEETGLEADLWLCGTVIVDAGETGVGLYVFTGEVLGGSPRESPEGQAEWIRADELSSIPTVEDVPAMVDRIRQMKPGDPPFSGRSYYDAAGKLVLEFDSSLGGVPRRES